VIYTVRALLAGFHDGRLDPVTVGREFGVDGGEAARRWQAGNARSLEGVPVVANGAEAQTFAALHGALAVPGRTAPLGLGGGAADVGGVARAGGVAVMAPGLPALAAPGAADLGAVLGALGQRAGAPALRVARIAGLAPGSEAARRADDLAASLLGGLGLSVQTLSVAGAGRMGAAAADADALLLPLDPALIDEAAGVRLAVLALPGSWDKGAHMGLLLAGADAVALTDLGARLSTALGG